MIDLSITKDPEWRKVRERLWKYYEKTIKGDFKKKDLETYKYMFMDGELVIVEGSNIRDGALDLFPIKNPEGWEYFLQNISTGKTPRILEGWLSMALRDSFVLTQLGWTFEEQCAFFHWLLGETYTPELRTKVPVGPNKDWLTHTLDPDWVFSQAIHVIYRWLEEGGEIDQESDYISIWSGKLNYLMSLFPLVDRRFFELELYPQRKEFKPFVSPYHVQFRLQKILAWMKDYERGGKKKGYLKEREQFLADFKSRLEALDPKPEGLDLLLDKFVR